MIYRMHPNFKDFAAFKMDEIAASSYLGDDFFLADPSPNKFAAKWQITDIQFENYAGTGKTKPVPDLIHSNGRLFLSDKAYRDLAPALQRLGEFLPVTYNKQKGYFFNPLKIAETYKALDKRLCLKNTFGELESIGFDESKLKGISIFKTEFDGYTGIYCGDDFKSLVENNSLQGVTFSADLGTVFMSDGTSMLPTSH